MAPGYKGEQADADLAAAPPWGGAGAVPAPTQPCLLSGDTARNQGFPTIVTNHARTLHTACRGAEESRFSA